MKIKYNTPIEITREQFNRVVPMFPMIVAHRIKNGRYYIMLWVMSYKDALIRILNK